MSSMSYFRICSMRSIQKTTFCGFIALLNKVLDFGGQLADKFCFILYFSTSKSCVLVFYCNLINILLLLLQLSQFHKKCNLKFCRVTCNVLCCLLFCCSTLSSVLFYFESPQIADFSCPLRDLTLYIIS